MHMHMRVRKIFLLFRYDDHGGIQFQRGTESGCGSVLHPRSDLRGRALPAGEHGHVFS